MSREIGSKNRDCGGEKRGFDERVENVDVWFPFSVCFVMDFTERVDFWLEMGGNNECERGLAG